MDPFEVRMHFVEHLKRLNASQQSIQKVVGYALKYFSRCGEDLWECVVEACQMGSLNTRINILYLLDSLCETSLLNSNAANRGSGSAESHGSYYVDFVARDIVKIVQLVVPDNRDGLMNLQSTTQILENWRTKRVLDPQTVDDVMETLDKRKESLQAQAAKNPPVSSSKSSREQIFKRIEEDRERHKRLRERRWVQSIDRIDHTSVARLTTFLPAASSSSSSSASSSHSQHTSPTSLNPSPASPSPHASQSNAQRTPSTARANGTPALGSSGLHPAGPAAGATGPSGLAVGPTNGAEFAFDIEFENAWETTSDWNEDDDDAVREENLLCFPQLPETGARPVSVNGGDQDQQRQSSPHDPDAMDLS